MSSKIKVDTIENVAGSGNVSLGSGHNLVVPGTLAITGATTLTGNLTVDTNTLFVNASANKVAVGTNSPNTSAAAALLQINKDGEALRIDGSANTARELFFRGTSSSNLASIHSDGSLKLRAEDAGTHMEFHTADTLGMNIDSSGRVTKPLQPSFRASPSGSTNLTSAGDIVFADVSGNPDFNTGSHYDTSNGRFTAPVAGNYLFCFSGYKQTSQSGGDINIRINGTNAGEVRKFNSNSNHETMEGTFIFKLSASDYVNLHSELQYLHLNPNMSHFSGYLLG